MTFEDLLKTFKVQADLNRDFWDDNNKLHPKIRKAMMNVAKNFYASVDIPNKPDIKDVTFTGSLANYNYSRLSDVDLHLLFDFTEYGENKEVFESLFLLAKASWNSKHDVKIKNYDVEVYAEDMSSPHHATGVYSVMNDEWIKEPKREVPVFDPEDVKSKLNYFIGLYKDLTSRLDQESPENLLKQVDMLRDKIGKFRKGGLEKGGDFSTENLAFKGMRRIGLLDKLADFRNSLVDKALSVENKK